MQRCNGKSRPEQSFGNVFCTKSKLMTNTKPGVPLLGKVVLFFEMAMGAKHNYRIHVSKWIWWEMFFTRYAAPGRFEKRRSQDKALLDLIFQFRCRQYSTKQLGNECCIFFSVLGLYVPEGAWCRGIDQIRGKPHIVMIRLTFVSHWSVVCGSLLARESSWESLTHVSLGSLWVRIFSDSENVKIWRLS